MFLKKVWNGFFYVHFCRVIKTQQYEAHIYISNRNVLPHGKCKFQFRHARRRTWRHYYFKLSY